MAGGFRRTSRISGTVRATAHEGRSIPPKGRLLLTGFNQPSHTVKPGDADCRDSTDGGKTWQLRGTVSERSDEKTNRALYAVGPTAKGDSVAIAGGYGDSEDRTGKRRLLQPVVTRSTDEGTTWEKVADFDWGLKPNCAAIPYGTIGTGKDGSLRASVYMTARKDVTPFNDAGNPFAAYMVRSDDGGKTWGKPAPIGKDVNGATALHVGDGEWIAAARTDDHRRSSAKNSGSTARRTTASSGRTRVL